MRTSSIVALAVAMIPNLAAAKCNGNGNPRPDHAIEVMNFMFDAGCELQQSNLEPSPKEFVSHRKASDGRCMTVVVKNHGDTRIVTSDQAVDAWAREWVGCEHGGGSTYDDKLEYIFHLEDVCG